jgi:hypothetical protein
LYTVALAGLTLTPVTTGFSPPPLSSGWGQPVKNKTANSATMERSPVLHHVFFIASLLHGFDVKRVNVRLLSQNYSFEKTSRVRKKDVKDVRA